MGDLGYTVIRFSGEGDWDAIIAHFPHIFGISASGISE
jgi:hypothetical protein